MEKEKKKAEEEFIEELLGKRIEEVFEENGDSGLFDEGEFDAEEEPEHEPENEHELESGGSEGLEFFEHGRKFRAPKEAVKAFAKAVGRSTGEVLRIYEKGCRFDELLKEHEGSKKDSEVFERLAEMRGISKDEMKAEILGALEKAQIEKIIGEIQENNPGMNRSAAEELAKFRFEAKKPANKEKKADEDFEKIRGKLREIDIFMAQHYGEGIESLEERVIKEWESGIPLERAFQNFRTIKEKEKLAAEIEQLKNEKMKNEQKTYAKEHSPGSATSAAGTEAFDAFVEGLFKEY